jgi:AcrR family transcriptional regulator
MPRRPEQFEEIREKSREKILTASLQLFAQNGYDSTTIDSIAKKAKISKGLIYNYYDSKKSILLAIYEDAMRQGMAMFERHKDKKDQYENMKGIILDFFDLLEGNPEYLKLIFIVSLQPGVLKDTKEYTRQMYERTQEMIGAIYAKANKKDPYAGMILDALLDGIMINYIRFGSQYPLAAIKERVIKQYCIKPPVKKQ